MCAVLEAVHVRPQLHGQDYWGNRLANVSESMGNTLENSLESVRGMSNYLEMIIRCPMVLATL